MARLKHYRRLASMTMEARKPISHPKPAHGAIGPPGAVQGAFADFEKPALGMADKYGLVIHSPADL